MSNRRRGRRGRGPVRRKKWAPNIFVGEGLSIATADTASSTTIFTNSEQFPLDIEFKSGKMGAASGGTATAVYAILRRVPQGYSAPAITPATGTTSFVDEANVLAYGYIQWVPSPLSNMSVALRPVFPRQTLFAGDTLVYQIVAGTTSASLVGSGLVELWSHAE